MKKIILSGLLISSISAFSQVIIGDALGTASDKSSVLLEFANTGNKGLLLPTVRVLPSTPDEGTILLDGSNPGAARVKFYNGLGANGGWQDLSGTDGDVNQFLNNQPTVAEEADSKAIIGADTSVADGVLVLESTTKAMVLPQVEDVNNVPDPSPGMMVFINKTGAKRLAVFNGTVWSFWKP